MRVTPFSTGDCLSKITSQYDIAVIAAKRARELKMGAKCMVDLEDGETEISGALREIAAGKVGMEYLTKENKHGKHTNRTN